MKHCFITLLGIAILACLVGCQCANSSDGGNLTLHPSTIGPIDAYRPLYEVDSTKRVSGSANVNILFGLFAWGDNAGIADNATIFPASGIFSFFSGIFPNAKNLAAKAAFYDACKKAGCDSVVSARYEIKSTNYFVFSKNEVTVTGFPAVQTGVETVKVMPYYIDTDGKMVKLDKFIIPVEIMNLDKTAVIKAGFLTGLF